MPNDRALAVGYALIDHIQYLNELVRTSRVGIKRDLISVAKAVKVRVLFYRGRERGSLIFHNLLVVREGERLCPRPCKKDQMLKANSCCFLICWS